MMRVTLQQEGADGEIDGLHIVIDDLGRESFGVAAHAVHELGTL